MFQTTNQSKILPKLWSLERFLSCWGVAIVYSTPRATSAHFATFAKETTASLQEDPTVEPGDRSPDSTGKVLYAVFNATMMNMGVSMVIVVPQQLVGLVHRKSQGKK